MKLATRGRLAERTLPELARHQEEGPIPLRDITRQEIPYIISGASGYLPLIMAGMARNSRGPAGGVQLLKSPMK